MKVEIIQKCSDGTVEMTIEELSETSKCVGLLQVDGVSKYMLCEGPVAQHENVKFMFMRPRISNTSCIWSWSSSLTNLLANINKGATYYIFDTQIELLTWMLEK